VSTLQLIFAAAFHKLDGKRVLFPQGFHCTGMPIKVRVGVIRVISALSSMQY